MRDRPRLDWSVPSEVWQQFRAYVQDEHGSLDGYLARETENAMREYADLDAYAAVEEQVKRLYDATGRSGSGELVKEKNLSNFSESRTRVAVRVDEQIAEEFRQFVDEHGTHPYGVELGIAVREYLDGGRAGRLERWLDEVVPEAEAALEDEHETGDETVSLTQKERKVIQISKNLGDQFTGAELNGEIHDIAGRGQKASRPTLEDYREQVLDRKDVVRHPFAADEIWIPSSELEEIVPDSVPEECAYPVEQLDTDERVWRIIYAVGRRAAKQSGIASVQAERVREEILDEAVDIKKTLTYLEEAAFYDGVTLDRHQDHASLRIDLHEMREAAAGDVQAIVEYRDGNADPILGKITEPTVADYTDTSSVPKTNSVEAALDRLDTNTPASADGGTEDPPDDQDD